MFLGNRLPPTALMSYMPSKPYSTNKSRPNSSRTLLTLIGAVCLPVFGTAVSAQETIISAPQQEYVAPVQRLQDQPPVYSRPSGPGETPFQYGSVSLHPHLLYRYLHASGLNFAPGQQVTSEINTFSAGLTVDAGKYWTIDYTPTWTNYSASVYRDTVDHSVSLRGATVYEAWAFQFSENFGISSPNLIETAQQTKQRTWATMAGATYTFTPHLQLETSAALSELYTDISPDTRDWSLTNWVSSKFGEDLDGALGLVIGYTDIIGLPDRTYQQYLGRMNWHFAQKLTLGVQGGLDVRHSKAANVSDLHNPLFQLSLAYQPFDTTKISVTDAQTVSNSYFADQVTHGNQLSINLEQRLLGHLFLSTGYSHASTKYTSTLVDNLVDRSDRVNSFHARLTTQLLQRLNVSVVYQTNRNNSNDALYSFSSNQYGLELGFRY